LGGGGEFEEKLHKLGSVHQSFSDLHKNKVSGDIMDISVCNSDRERACSVYTTALMMMMMMKCTIIIQYSASKALRILAAEN
jgi:hypothetical protein